MTFAAPAPTRPFWRVMSLIFSFAFGCAVSVLLWTYWTPRCDEGCAPSAVVGLLVFLALFPVLCTGVVATVQATRWPMRARVAAALVALAAAAVVMAHLGQIARTSGPASAEPHQKTAGLR